MAVNLLSSADPLRDVWLATRAATPWKDQWETFAKYHHLPLLQRMLKGRSPRTVSSGSRIEWRAVLDDTGNMTWVSPYEPVTYTATDIIGSFGADWTLGHGSHLITDDEIQENSGTLERLLDLRRVKREECLSGMANTTEKQLWGYPTGADAEAIAKKPFGVSYSVVPITGAQVTTRVTTLALGPRQTGFFGGMNCTGFSACYGVDSSAAKYERYRNYVDVWTSSSGDLTEDDVQKIVRMLRQIFWTGPINATEFASGNFSNLLLATVEEFLDALDVKGRANNDNLGADLGKFAGQVVTKGVPFIWAPALEELALTTRPLIAVDTNVLEPVVFSGENFREASPERLQGQPRVLKTDVWLKLQLLNRNRRRNGRIDWVAAA